MNDMIVPELDHLDYTIIALYLAGMIGIGLWIARKVRSFESFFVAGRAMTTPLLISTLVSTYYGLDVTFGVSEVSMKEGVVAWFVYARPYYLMLLIAGLVLVHKLKSYPFLSLPDIVDHFYGKGSRITVALASFLYNLPIISIIGMGVVFHLTLGVTETQGYLLGAAIALVYTLPGGLWADVLTDTVQFVLMCVTLAIAIPFALDRVGGVPWMQANLAAKYFAPMGDISSAYLLALVLTALSVLVEPGLYQRIFGARDERSVRRALIFGIAIWAAYDWGVTILGIAAAAAVKQNLLPPNLEGRQALIQIVLFSLPIGLKGAFIAGILSAAMSTVDSYLLLSSGNLIYDIFRPLFRPTMTDRDLLKYSRIGIVLALIACLIIAAYFKKITDAWVFMSTVLTATALIPIMAGLFLPNRRKPAEGMAATLCGLATVLIYYATLTYFGRADNDSYVWQMTVAGQSWELWREYSLFFALPASAVGFLLGGALGGESKQS